ncbi:MAG: hypothetical protein UX21_C0007G0036 [Microgenomates group bacterium GW2011_GWC2_45_8]|nr:MAG: hypothetical protein UX21_C0007G0036 [Microgenomates group bacterium GW2011_GWC2_45_8]
MQMLKSSLRQSKTSPIHRNISQNQAKGKFLPSVFFPYPIGEDRFDKGLVGNVALVGHNLEIIDKRDGKANGNGPGTWFEGREIHLNWMFHVEIVGSVVSVPEISLIVFRCKFWDW